VLQKRNERKARGFPDASKCGRNVQPRRTKNQDIQLIFIAFLQDQEQKKTPLEMPNGVITE